MKTHCFGFRSSSSIGQPFRKSILLQTYKTKRHYRIQHSYQGKSSYSLDYNTYYNFSPYKCNVVWISESFYSAWHKNLHKILKDKSKTIKYHRARAKDADVQAFKGTRCLGSVELVFKRRSVTVCYKLHMGRKML